MIDFPQLQLLEIFHSILGTENAHLFSHDLAGYGQDCTLNYKCDFDFLLFPNSSLEIASILKTCREFYLPIVIRGGGTGVAGGALPIHGGVVLSMERMNKILQVNTEDGYVICESGVVSNDLSLALGKLGFFFPVFPSSKRFSFVGGNVATNAGSVYSCKYGKTDRYVLNVEVVLPAGETIWTGSNVKKNSTGFNLTQLFVGSEGVLGVVTKVVYRILPISLVKSKAVILAIFNDLKSGVDFVIDVKNSNVDPAAVELIGHNALRITSSYLEMPFDQAVGKHVHVLIELHEKSENALNNSVDTLTQIIKRYSQNEIILGLSQSEQDALWNLRLNIGNALTDKKRYYRDIDIAVPIIKLYDYFLQVELIGRRHDIEIVYFGHALDGNPHVMLLIEDDHDYNENFQKAVSEIYTYALSVGGVISGEHGVGCLQKDYMPAQFDSNSINVMKQLKMTFDPTGILNPGKLWD